MRFNLIFSEKSDNFIEFFIRAAKKTCFLLFIIIYCNGMQNVFLPTLAQVSVLVIFIVIGYILKLTGKVKDGKVLSSLLLWVFLPAVVFKVFSENFTVSKFGEAKDYLIAGCVVFGVVLGSGYLIACRYSDRMKRNVLWYSFVVTNMSYVGITLIDKLLNEYVLYYMVFIMPFQVFVFTAGSAMFKPEKEGISLKGLLSPVNIAMVLGMIVGVVFDLCNVQIPSVISTIVASASGCMSSAAMLLTGIILADQPVKEVFGSVEAYVFTFLRLAVFPALFGGIAYLLQLWLGFSVGIVKMTIIYLALPFGLNSVVFSEAYGGDGSLGAKIGFLSHLFCIITMPLWFMAIDLI